MGLSPVIVALDVPTAREALAVVDATSDYVDIYKVGPILFMRHGPSLLKELSAMGKRVFLDLKLHDIPNTVRGAVLAAAELGVFMLTLHLCGGRAMLEAAVEAASGSGLLLLGVSVLTSMDDARLEEVGVPGGCASQVERLVRLGLESGIGGFVCSPLEVSALRGLVGDATLVVPGVRPKGSAADDQKRVATPREAVEAGADYIVVGRPIYASDDPRAAAESIYRSVEDIRKSC